LGPCLKHQDMGQADPAELTEKSRPSPFEKLKVLRGE
jgi:hypothetical protein